LPSSSNIKPAIKKSIIIYYSYLNNTLNGFFYCKKGISIDSISDRNEEKSKMILIV